MNHSPLPLGARILFWLLGSDAADCLRGDLEERYRRALARGVADADARRALFTDALRTLAAWWAPMALWRRLRAGQRTRHLHTRRPMLDALGSDVRVSARALARRPAFTALVVLTLGLGIGATTTIYSVVDAVLVRPLPYNGADRLLAVGNTFPGREWADEGGGLQRLAGVSLLNFEEWRARTRTLSSLAAVQLTNALLPDAGDGPELVPLGQVSEEFFSLFDVAPVLGRSLLPIDYDRASEGVVLLSHASWMRRFGGDPSVIGQPLSTFGRSSTIIGVLPEYFVQPAALGSASIEFWSPIDAAHPRYASRGARQLFVFGRLAEGATLASARAELDGIQQQLAVEFPDGNVFPNGDRFGAGANLLHADTVGGSERVLFIFFGAAALLFLISALNAANLLLVRGLDRQVELGIRGALGAGRGRLAWGLLVESVMLSVAGGAMGVLLADAGIAAFLRFAPTTLPRLAEVTMNLRIVALSAAFSLGAGIVVGLIPALRLTGGNILTATHAHGSGSTAAPAGMRLRAALVAAQLAVAVVLVVGASLLFNSFLHVTRVDSGFSAEGLATFRMPLKRPGAPAGEETWMAWDRLLAELRSVGGSGQVAAGSNLPFESPNWAPPVLLPGEPANFRREGVAGYVVTPNYFSVLGIPLTAGRPFATEDGATSARVAIVNATFVREHLAGVQPLGHTLRYRTDGDSLVSLQIVGVAGDVIQTRAEEGARAALYVPYTQTDWPIAKVALRGYPPLESFAPELRRAVARFSPYVPLRDLEMMTARIAEVRTEPRFQMLLLLGFASIALLLAAVGLYGSLAHAVGRRTREMGIRMALGAPRAGIFRLVYRQGMLVTGIGLAAGVVAAIALARFVQAFLFGIGALDLTSFALALLVLTLVAAVAILVPARRATAVDVVRSLRSE